MSITIDMSDQEIAAIKQLTHLDDGGAAVTQAARQFLRLSRLRELKAASGMVEFNDNWQELEELEITEEALPR